MARIERMDWMTQMIQIAHLQSRLLLSVSICVIRGGTLRTASRFGLLAVDPLFQGLELADEVMLGGAEWAFEEA